MREDEQVVHHHVERDDRVAHDGGHAVREDEQVEHHRVERDDRVAHDGGHEVREDEQATQAIVSYGTLCDDEEKC